MCESKPDRRELACVMFEGKTEEVSDRPFLPEMWLREEGKGLGQLLEVKTQ